MSATDRIDARLGKAEVLDLAFPDQVLYGSCDVFNGHVRVDAVLVEQIDSVDLETFERRFRGTFYVLSAAVQAASRSPSLDRYRSRTWLRSPPDREREPALRPRALRS